MTTRKIHAGYDSNGRKFEYELDIGGISMTHDGQIVTDTEDSRTKTKRLR